MRSVHGHSMARKGRGTPTYVSWRSMIARCYNPKHVYYARYGGRGIVVCERWRKSFPNFLADMGEVPEKLQIERIDSDKNYEPGNCKWATVKEQALNRRSNVRVTIDGVTRCVGEWRKIYKLGHNTYAHRRKQGLSIVEALTLPRGAPRGSLKKRGTELDD